MNRYPRPLLLPFVPLYRGYMSARNFFFDRNLLQSKRVRPRVISIGNISSGGSGKTPATIEVCRLLGSNQKSYAIVSRGFRRRSAGLLVVAHNGRIGVTVQESGDEPFMIASILLNAPFFKGVIVGESKYDAAEKADTLWHPDVIVVDDGFQHRYLKRDADLVMLSSDDAVNGIGLLPAGKYREPLRSLGRADAVILVGVAEKFNEAKHSVSKVTKAPVFLMEFVLDRYYAAESGATTAVHSLSGKRVLLVCAIADPERVARMVSAHGLEIVGRKFYPDHHWFGKNDLAEVLSTMRQTSADYCLTTEKDLHRLKHTAGDAAAELLKRTLVLALKAKVNEESSFVAFIEKRVSHTTKT